MTSTYFAIYNLTGWTLGDEVFRFYLHPINFVPDFNKTGVANIDIPSQLRPIGFDATSQTRTLRLDFILMANGAYQAAYPGTGSIFDQMEDLDKLCQKIALGSGCLYALSVPFVDNFTSGHVTSTDNIPTVTGGSNTKVYLVNFKHLTFTWEAGARTYLRGSVDFEEVDDQGVIVL